MQGKREVLFVLTFSSQICRTIVSRIYFLLIQMAYKLKIKLYTCDRVAVFKSAYKPKNVCLWANF